MASDDKWCFTKEQLDGTPSRQCGIDAFRELVFRQQAGNFIQDMGQRLKVTQLCINTAIVYMHRFFVFHSFTQFPWNSIAAAALFLAAKVEEQPRKLEHVIRVHQVCRNIRENIDINSERYQQQCQDLVFNENILLQTLGFDVAIDHPHTHVVRCCHLVGASKDLAQTSYFMASNSLHLTTMCLQYKPTIVACFCIHLACKWSNWEIPLSNEDREWFTYVDPLVTGDLLKQLTEEFLKIFDKCPQKLKEKIMANGGDGQQIPGGNGTSVNSPFDSEPRRIAPTDESRKYSEYHIGSSTKTVCEDSSGSTPIAHPSKAPHPRGARPSISTTHDSTGTSLPQQPNNAGASVTQQRDREYREKKERERLATNALQQQYSQYNNSSSTCATNRRPPPAAAVASASNHHAVITPTDEFRHRHIDKAKMAPPSSSATSSYPRPQNSANPQPQPPQRREVYRDSNKREHNHLLKPNAMLDGANSVVYNSAPLDQKPVPQSKPPQHSAGAVQLAQQHPKQPYLKQQTHDIKRLLNSAEYDQHKLNTGYLKQGKVKLEQPCHSSAADSLTNKSVPINNSNRQSIIPPANVKQDFPGNGYQGNNGSYNTAPSHLDAVKVEQQQQMPVKKPSMFSPEKTPPRGGCSALKQPTPVKIAQVKVEPEQSIRRTRTISSLSSSSSEPELRPVIKKIDQVEGFENILRDNTIRTHGLMPQDGKAPDMAAMTKPEVAQTVAHQVLVNGIETNPTLISNLLKETALPPMSSHLSTMSAAVAVVPVVSEEAPKEHHHHKERKKKSKEKHKHKDKEKDKSRHNEDGVGREKKKKHKDRHRKDKSAQVACVVTATAASIATTTAQPIKITIPRDKIQSTETLKIKISKDRINTESITDNNAQTPSVSATMSTSSTSVSNATSSSTGLKIKIAKIPAQGSESSSATVHRTVAHSSTVANHRKRDREPTTAKGAEVPPPPTKLSRPSANQMAPVGGGKQNGRNSNYQKVSQAQQVGDGGCSSSIHRFADSKYLNKGSSA